MAIILTVTTPFLSYAKGDRIEGPEEIASVLESENADKVVRVSAPDAPEPAAVSKKKQPAADAPTAQPS